MAFLSFKPITFIVSICLFLLASTHCKAQDRIQAKLSIGASLAYAPKITLGSSENSGIVSSVFGELEYGKLIGRLQYTSPLISTFNEDNNLDGGSSYHGSLGYSFSLKENLKLAVMLSGGAAVVNYNNGIFGSSGDQFTNVSPQVGINVFPTYQISPLVSVQGGLRYYKGFEAGDRGRASDLFDLGIGLRLSL